MRCRAAAAAADVCVIGSVDEGHKDGALGDDDARELALAQLQMAAHRPPTSRSHGRVGPPARAARAAA